MPKEAVFYVHDPCPYLPGRNSAMEIHTDVFEPDLYERLLPFGWRRSGSFFYRYICSGCGLCIPLRLSADSLAVTGRLKRIIRRNSDLTIRLLPPTPREEYFLLYEKYSIHRHENSNPPSVDEFKAMFSYDSSAVVEYRSADRSLEGLGFIDVLPSGFSSVYFIFDPLSSRRSLGYYSVLREAELAQESGRKWYYLGFWVPGSRKMDYKADFSPFQIAAHPTGIWENALGREAALALMERRRA